MYLCIWHELLIAKLNAYRFNLPAVRLIHDYLLSRKQDKDISFIWWMAFCNVVCTTRFNFGLTFIEQIFSFGITFSSRFVFYTKWYWYCKPCTCQCTWSFSWKFSWCYGDPKFENNFLKGYADNYHFLVSTT